MAADPDISVATTPITARASRLTGAPPDCLEFEARSGYHETRRPKPTLPRESPFGAGPGDRVGRSPQSRPALERKEDRLAMDRLARQSSRRCARGETLSFRQNVATRRSARTANQSASARVLSAPA